MSDEDELARFADEVLAYGYGSGPAPAPLVLGGVRVAFQGCRTDDRIGAVQVTLDPPLDLGLRIAGQGILQDALENFIGPRDIHLGDPHFDLLKRVDADEPERVRALIDGAARAGLLPWDEVFHDGGCEAWVCAWEPTPESPDPTVYQSAPGELLARIRCAVGACRPVDERRDAVPPPAAIAPGFPGLEALAVRYGLRLRRTPVRLDGEIEDTPVSLATARTGPLALSVTITARFAQPLDVGLALSPAGLLNRLREWVGADLRTGDREFDAAFSLGAREPAAAAALLDAAGRGDLVSLINTAAAVDVDDERLRVRFALGSDGESAPGTGPRAEVVPTIIELCATVARRMTALRFPRAVAGPYR